MTLEEKSKLREQKKAIKDKKVHETYQKIANGNKQRLLTFICYFIIIIVVIASSIIQLGFGFGEDYDWGQFAFKLALGLAISILGMILSIKDGELANEDRKWGDYFDARIRYKISRGKISDTECFRQWTDDLYFREKNAFINSQLSTANIYKSHYIYLKDNDLARLKEEPLVLTYMDDKGKMIEEPFPQITAYQYEIIKIYKEGRFTFNKLEYTFFTSGRGVNGYKMEADKGRKQQSRKVMAITYRVLLFLMTTFIFAAAMVNPNKGDAGQVAFDLIGRLLNLASSMFFGYSLATQEARENADSLDYKSDMIDQFSVELEIGSFKPINIDEITLRKIQEIRERKEKERLEKERLEQEAINNVVNTEVVEKPIEGGEETIEVDADTYKQLVEQTKTK